MSLAILVQITAPHFCAGVEFDAATSLCTRAAPILHWMKAKRYRDLQTYCQGKGWEFTPLQPTVKPS